MKEAYFNSDIYKVINSLEKYVTPQDAINLIFDIDCINYATTKDEYRERFEKIKKTIGKIQSTKLKRELEDGIIDIEEFERRKFFDIDLYENYNFIYSDRKSTCIQEYKEGYKVISEFSEVCLDKDKVDLKFDSDVKIIR